MRNGAYIVLIWGFHFIRLLTEFKKFKRKHNMEYQNRIISVKVKIEVNTNYHFLKIIVY